MSGPSDHGPGTVLPERSIAISEALIMEYAELSGDFNSIHVDPAAGAAAGFGGVIAHGCIPLEPICQSVQAFLGADVLPPQTIIRLRYRAPSRPGDVIRSRATVKCVPQPGLREPTVIAFSCLNQEGTTVLEGEVEIGP